MNYSPLTPHPYPLIVLVGPTASGKSELAVKLAKRFNGEIISCDSRQIYKGLDLGTGKIEGKWKNIRSKQSPFHAREKGFAVFVYKNINHYLIDSANPARQYSVVQFQKQSQKTIADILKRGKLPILCGGTAHWVDAVVYNQQLPQVKPDLKLRASLEKKSVGDLFAQLKKLDPVRAQSIDPKNPRRLIRALEIVLSTGKPVPYNPTPISPYNPLWLGIKTDQNDLYKKIDLRLKQRLKQGMVKEVEQLHHSANLKSYISNRKFPQGLSWKRLESFGLEYKYISLYLQNKISYDEMLTQLSFAIKHYSKRQLTWWKRNKNIHWIQNEAEAKNLATNFLK